LARYRSADIDATYAAAYDQHPLEEPDEWGDWLRFDKQPGLRRKRVDCGPRQPAGRLRDTRMREVCAALAVAVDCSD
jgi:hypothetical protein